MPLRNSPAIALTALLLPISSCGQNTPPHTAVHTATAVTATIYDEPPGPGTVTLTGGGQLLATAPVAADGRFSLRLPMSLVARQSTLLRPLSDFPDAGCAGRLAVSDGAVLFTKGQFQDQPAAGPPELLYLTTAVPSTIPTGGPASPGGNHGVFVYATGQATIRGGCPGGDTYDLTLTGGWNLVDQTVVSASVSKYTSDPQQTYDSFFPDRSNNP